MIYFYTLISICSGYWFFALSLPAWALFWCLLSLTRVTAETCRFQAQGRLLGVLKSKELKGKPSFITHICTYVHMEYLYTSKRYFCVQMRLLLTWWPPTPADPHWWRCRSAARAWLGLFAALGPFVVLSFVFTLGFMVGLSITCFTSSWT